MATATDAAAAPATAVAGDAALRDAISASALAEVLRRYEELSSAVDDEHEPYRSKYEARRLLVAYVRRVEVAATAAGESPLVARAADIVARCRARVGVNCVVTEENTSGEIPLTAAVSHLRRFFEPATPPQLPPPRRSLASMLTLGGTLIEAANYLALLYSGWEKVPQALAHVRLAKAVYRRCRDLALAAIARDAAAAATLHSRLVHLDSLYTHTLFYLVQLYSRLGESEVAAGYVAALLQRQLAEQEAYGSGSSAAAAAPAAVSATAGAEAAPSAAAPAAGVDVDSVHQLAISRAAGPDWSPVAGSAPAEAALESPGAVVADTASIDDASPTPLLDSYDAVDSVEYRAPAASLDRLEWARNAMRLSDYYVGKGRYTSAAHCIAAADVVLAQAVRLQRATKEAAAGGAGAGAGAAAGSATGEHAALSASASTASAADLPDSLQRLLAEAAVFWGKLYLASLRVARERGMAELDARDTGRKKPKRIVDIDEEAEEAARAAARTRSGGASVVALEAGAGAGAGASGGRQYVYEWVEEEVTGEDPFSTIPGSAGLAGAGGRIRRRVKRPRPAGAGAGASTGSGNMIGSGADALDVDDSDHEGDVGLAAAYVAAADAAGSRPASAATVASTAAHVDGDADGGESGSRASTTSTAAASVATADAGAVAGSACAGASLEAVLATGREGLPFAGFLRRHLSDIATVPTPFYGPTRIGSIVVADAATAGSGSASSVVVSGLSRLVKPDAVTSFDVARDLFKAASVAFQRGVQFLVLDGFVTDHVSIMSHWSKAYKYLSFWEADHKRAAAMHGRRVAMLAPLLKALNPAIYINDHKELSVELASAAQEQMEQRNARAEARVKAERTPMTADEAGGVNEALDAAVNFFVHFLRCYKDRRLTGAPIGRANEPLEPWTGATELDDGSVEAYLTSHFSVARLLTRRLAPTPLARVDDLRASLARFEWLVKHGPALVPASAPSGFFETEFRMAGEMARLLPQRLNLVHHRGTDPSAVWYGGGGAAAGAGGGR